MELKRKVVGLGLAALVAGVSGSCEPNTTANQTTGNYTLTKPEGCQSVEWIDFDPGGHSRCPYFEVHCRDASGNPLTYMRCTRDDNWLKIDLR